MSPRMSALPRNFINNKHSWCKAALLLSNVQCDNDIGYQLQDVSSSSDQVFKKFSDDPLLKRLGLRADGPEAERTKVLHPYLCTICGQKFTTAFNRNRHKKSCNPLFRFRCSRCSLGFASRSDVAAHVSQAHWLKCSNCSSRFPSKKRLIKHHKSHELKCSTCGKLFQSSRKLLRHIRIHTKKFLCALCQRRFSTRYSLKLHTKAHKGTRPYICGVCSCSFSKPVGLSGHMKMHSAFKTPLP